MIDEKKLIEALKNEILKTYTPDYILVLERAIEIVNEQPKISEWIPCSLCSPENGDYLICDSEGDVYESKYRNGCWIINSSANQVLAWKPLPKTYKGE